MKTIYIVQKLDGYTDGKPSWSRVFTGWRATKEGVLAVMKKMQEQNPSGKYRVRKAISK